MLSAFLSTLALLPLSLLCFLSTPTPAGGQNFTVPSGWSVSPTFLSSLRLLIDVTETDIDAHSR